MYKGSDEFDGGIDINSILNDSSLHDELASLGWKDSTVKKKSSNIGKPTKPPKNTPASPPAPTKQPSQMIEPLDIGDMGLLDESSMTLTEHDMQDEGLLAEFDEINNAGNDEEEDQDQEDEHEEEEPSDEEEASAQPAATGRAAPARATLSSQQSQQNVDNSGIPTAEEAKRNAIKYKREGNTTEALKWLRYAKQIESTSLKAPVLPPGVVINTSPVKPAKPTPNNTTNTNNPNNYTNNTNSRTAKSPTYDTNTEFSPASHLSDPFLPLESAIQEASKHALQQAKSFEKSDPKQAVVHMREYKALQQDMQVLQSRRATPGAGPALFHWATTRKETRIENMNIAEDEVKLTIQGLYDVSGLIESHSSRSVGISYLLGVNKEETTATLTPQYKYENGSVVMNYTVTLPVLKRGKHVQALYARKKATFDVILYKGFWKGNETLCSATLPLSELVSKSNVGGPLALKSVGEKKKALGGNLTATVTIRSPLGGPEVVYSEERRLVIEAWPAVTPIQSPPGTVYVGSSTSNVSSLSNVSTGFTTTSGNTNTNTNNGISTRNAMSPGPDTTHPTTTDTNNTTNPTTTTAPVLTGALATLTDQERNDPHSVDFIESNDVLESEIATAQALLTTSTDEDEQFNNTMRLQLLNGKLQLLVYQVQSEQLTMEQYLEKIKSRLKRDQLIALYLKTVGDSESIASALRVMKRVNLMKKEIQNAEEAQQEEQE